VKVRAIVNWAGCILVGVGLSACAGTAPSLPSAQYLASPEKTEEPQAIADPNEQFNRSVFESNQKFNHAVLYPVAKAYNGIPEDVRDRVAAFAANLSEPMVFANNILQLRLKAAATTFGRFAVNTTIGLGGLFDVATAQGMNAQSGDFGQTLYVWGYRDSSYAVLPIIGPTNVRDAIGGVVEFAAELPAGLSGVLVPVQYASMANVVGTAGTVTSPLTKLSKAEDMQTLEESSIDFYTMLKSVTDQKRQAELQEALKTSALTGEPVPPDPNAIEPVTVLVSSPTMLPQRQPANATVEATAPVVSSYTQRGGTVVVIGPPTPVSASPAD
jgi:phospholipid-binding lipoprotein MlaA